MRERNQFQKYFSTKIFSVVMKKDNDCGKRKSALAEYFQFASWILF